METAQDIKTHSLLHIFGGKSQVLLSETYQQCFIQREQFRKQNQFKNGIIIIIPREQ